VYKMVVRTELRTEKQGRIKTLRPVAFRPHLSMGLVLSKIENDFVRPPLGRSLREVMFKVLETGPLHNFLERMMCLRACIKLLLSAIWEGGCLCDTILLSNFPGHQ